MKILLPVKRVVDFNVKVRVKSDGTGVDVATLVDKLRNEAKVCCRQRNFDQVRQSLTEQPKMGRSLQLF